MSAFLAAPRALVPSLAALLLAGGIAAPAVQAAEPLPVPVVPVVEDGELGVLVWDHRALLAAGPTTKPLSLWWDKDPDVQKAVSYIKAQIDIVKKVEREKGIIALWDLVENGVGIAAVARPIDMREEDRRDPLLAMVVDTGNAKVWQDFFDEESKGDDVVTLDGFTGARKDVFFGLKGSLFLLGSDEMLPEGSKLPGVLSGLVAKMDGKTKPYVAALSFDLGRVLAGIATLDEKGSDLFGLDKIIPGWRTLKSRITMGIAPSATDGLCGTIAATGLPDMGLKPLPADLVAMIRPDQHVVLAVSGSTREALKRLESPEGEQMLAELVRDDEAKAMIKKAVGHLSGDLLVMVRSQGMPPTFSVVAPLAGAAGDDTGLAEILGTVLTEDAGVEGATKSWFIATPAGLITIAVNAKRLVVTTDPTATADLLAGKAGGGLPKGMSIDPSSGGVLFADLQTLGQQWLPQLYALIGDHKEAMTNDPVNALRWGLADTLASSEANSFAEALGDAEWHKDSLARLFPDAPDAVAEASKSLGIWRKKVDDMAMCRIVIRLEAGYRIFDSSDYDIGRREFTAEDATKEMEGWNLRFGPGLAAQPVVKLPPVAYFDRNWLPPLAAVVRHLPAWQVDVKRNADGTTIMHERGFPLLTTLGGILATVWTVEGQDDIRREAQYKIAELAKAEVMGRHEKLGALLVKVHEGLKARQQNGDPMPERASDLVTLGIITLEDAAAVMPDGKAPKDATALDSVGTWDAMPSDWPRMNWRVPVEDGWHAGVGADQVWGRGDQKAYDLFEGPVPPKAKSEDGNNNGF